VSAADGQSYPALQHIGVFSCPETGSVEEIGQRIERQCREVAKEDEGQDSRKYEVDAYLLDAFIDKL
jgi:hypothetical protein